MKTVRLGLLALLAVCAAAQNVPEFHEAMEATDKATVALKKLEPKTGPQAVSNAERMGGIYEDMIGFWRQRNASDAVKWSEQGKAAAVQLAAAAKSGEAAPAAAAFQSLIATCKSCHSAHRERLPDGKFRIK
jgi:cytochrome c556